MIEDALIFALNSLDGDIVIHSILHSQIGQLESTVNAFKAAAENFYVEDTEQGMSIQERNAHSQDAPLFTDMLGIERAVQKTLETRALARQ